MSRLARRRTEIRGHGWVAAGAGADGTSDVASGRGARTTIVRPPAVTIEPAAAS